MDDRRTFERRRIKCRRNRKAFVVECDENIEEEKYLHGEKHRKPEHSSGE
jgi:hypothetical protein